jgi:hypothetical protein
MSRVKVTHPARLRQLRQQNVTIHSLFKKQLMRQYLYRQGSRVSSGWHRTPNED